MKKNNKVFVIGISLALALFALDSCKRSTVTEPSPVGPSSIAVILSLTASPNTMFSGQYVRETSTITATLKKYDGVPLREFNEALEYTEAVAVTNHLGVVNNAAAKGEWKASLEWLRRRRRADWGDNVDVTTNGERIVPFDYSKLIGATTRPVSDSDAPGQDESNLHGQTLGQDHPGGHSST